jgi:hypothetical protein
VTIDDAFHVSRSTVTCNDRRRPSLTSRRNDRRLLRSAAPPAASFSARRLRRFQGLLDVPLAHTHCLWTVTNLYLGLDGAKWELRTALQRLLAWLQSCCSSSCRFPLCNVRPLGKAAPWRWQSRANCTETDITNRGLDRCSSCNGNGYTRRRRHCVKYHLIRNDAEFAPRAVPKIAQPAPASDESRPTVVNPVALYLVNPVGTWVRLSFTMTRKIEAQNSARNCGSGVYLGTPYVPNGFAPSRQQHQACA